MIQAKITGVGHYLPQSIITNATLAETLDTTDEWISTRTGIKQRHVAASQETAASMAENAARAALDSAGLLPTDIDLILVATSTPDCFFPSTAVLVQAGLGLHGCPAFDVGAACAGFSYGLTTAWRFIQTGQAKHALIIGSEVLSRLVDWSDRETCVLFGDGAGAVVLSASDSPGIIDSILHADGAHSDKLYAKNPCATEALDANLHMSGRDVFKFAVNTLGQLVTDILSKHQLTGDALDWLIPHQANQRIIKSVADKINLPLEKVILTIDKHANTSSASIPLAMSVAIADGRIKAGDLLLLESFGGGFVWGGTLIQY